MMSDLIVWREKLQKIYASYSIYIDKAAKFILGMLVFCLINDSIGFMKMLATPVMAVALAVISAFLPFIFTVFAAAALMLIHFFQISAGVMMISVLVFFMMFIFYCRFAPKESWILLVTPLAFLLNVPYVIPIICGLAMVPASLIPVIFGTIIYYMIACVETTAAAISGAEGMAEQIALFTKGVFQNKSMWITIMAFTICVLTVYAVKCMAIEHAWKIAMALGVITNILVMVIGDVAFDIHMSYGMLILGNLLAIGIGIVGEFFLFSVDYSRAEYLQYEDDEYYYYVKAIPKISIAEPEKMVKKINERRKVVEQVSEGSRNKGSVRIEKRNAVNRTGRRTTGRRKTRIPENTEELLLAKSLQEELDIQNIVKQELQDKPGQ